MASRDGSRVVWSSGIGRIRYCPTCHQPEDECRCAAQRAATEARPGMPRNDGIVRIARDRKHRNGKVATLIVGLPDDAALLTDLAKTLKRLCGVGGTVKDGVIELQGDHVPVIQKKLTELGYRVKVAGG